MVVDMFPIFAPVGQQSVIWDYKNPWTITKMLAI